jgi:uncharacterized tellurite resistance protein B-like protein
MNISNLTNVLKLFRGHRPTANEKSELVGEALLMTLARASSEDTNITPVEVSTVQNIIKKVTGHEVTEADVRIAAHADLFEERSLEDCLAHVRGELESKDRAMIVRSLAEVIKSDVTVTAREVAFFDKVASALKVTPAEVAGLIPGDA